MEKEIVITRRFRKNTFRTYSYLSKKFSPKTAFAFLNNIDERIELIAKNPFIGKPSVNKEHIRSIILAPHNLIFIELIKSELKFFVCLI